MKCVWMGKILDRVANKEMRLSHEDIWGKCEEARVNGAGMKGLEVNTIGDEGRGVKGSQIV